MQFEKNHLYHIYNQGNNRERIFFTEANYLFFLKKFRIHILPYCDILAYCLMPNHFHLMVRINYLDLPIQNLAESLLTNKSKDTRVTKYRTLNESIGIMLRSYTNAINKQEKRSGKLIREGTKAICLTQSNSISSSFYNTKYGTVSYPEIPEEKYPPVCFNYIHQNPVSARLVKSSVDWEFSSARDYARLRDGTLINKAVTAEFISHTDGVDKV